MIYIEYPEKQNRVYISFHPANACFSFVAGAIPAQLRALVQLTGLNLFQQTSSAARD